jgi:plastocyanin
MTRKTILYLSAISIVAIFIVSVFPDASAENYKVNIPSGTLVPGCEETNECWDPPTVTINVGDQVTWYNDDNAAHTVTSGSVVGQPDGIFDSSLFLSGNSFSVKFDGSDGPGVAGSYQYYCMVHPWMIGTITVEASAQEIVLPDWIRNIAIWWGENTISDQEFARAIEYLLGEGIIEGPAVQDAAAQDIQDKITELEDDIEELKEKLEENFPSSGYKGLHNDLRNHNPTEYAAKPCNQVEPDFTTVSYFQRDGNEELIEMGFDPIIAHLPIFASAAEQPYIGEIVLFGGNFAPRSWHFADGQILQVNNYNSLFSILGWTYGGDGTTTFALPDLRCFEAENGPRYIIALQGLYPQRN